ncbi:unannotated protein [freshwater metagenome]|uniref:Unannotated protein n=1 Tax=freshwater metagenome TaxID=449393 RepID=A0A6J7EGF1_9ZZZZ|nr:hypothetical protein [Actinomycetota bacterium]
MRHRLIGTLLAVVLAITTTVVVPAASPLSTARPALAAADPVGNLVVGFTKLLVGSTTRATVYNNIDQLEKDLRTQYDAYAATAAKNNDTRTQVLLTRERDLQIGWLEGVRKNTGQTITGEQPFLLLSMIANTKEAQKFLGRAGSEVLKVKSKITGLRTAITTGSVGSALVETRKWAAQLENLSGSWSIIAGSKGAEMAAAADRVSRALRRVDAAAADADKQLESLGNDLQQISNGLAALDQVPRRPRGGNGILGFILNFVRVDKTVVDVLAELFNPRLRNMPGVKLDKLQRDLRTALSEFIRRRLHDCVKQAGPQLRYLIENEPSDAVDTGSLGPPVDDGTEKLPLCDPLTAAEVEELAGNVEQVQETSKNAPEPTADKPFAGGEYQVTEKSNSPTAMARLARIGTGSLTVRDLSQRPLFSLGADLIGTPSLDLLFDLGAGTVTGTFAADFACVPSTCGGLLGETSTGHVEGEFGPLQYGVPPTAMPADFPFPEHHWYAPSTGIWWAGGAIDLRVRLSGSYTLDQGLESGSYDTTLKAWVSSELTPAGSYSATLRPAGWRANFSVRIDHPDTVIPQWSLYLGADADIYDGNVATPPRS